MTTAPPVVTPRFATWVGPSRFGTAMISRTLAFFLAVFTLLNLLGDRYTPGFNANQWWIDLRFFPGFLSIFLLLATAVVLLAYAIFPRMAPWRATLTTLLVGGMGATAILNIFHFIWLLCRGGIRSSFPVPFSLVIAACLTIILIRFARPVRRRIRLRDVFVAVTAFAACLVLFPLAQMFCFGYTDYRRSADAILVFGARTYADGKPSAALEDRVLTACHLYHAGYAKVLIMSGGPGDGSTHETEAMRDLAVARGVPVSAILLDRTGLNTEASLRTLVTLAKEKGFHRILAVSHFYHLPRIKMAFERVTAQPSPSDGTPVNLELFTVPTDSNHLTTLPRLVAREVVALWAYYLGPLMR